jgi:hypothetical protein
MTGDVPKKPSSSSSTTHIVYAKTKSENSKKNGYFAYLFIRIVTCFCIEQDVTQGTETGRFRAVQFLLPLLHLEKPLLLPPPLSDYCMLGKQIVSFGSKIQYGRCNHCTCVRSKDGPLFLCDKIQGFCISS